MQLAAACEPAQAEEERGACVDHVRRCARLGGEGHLHARLQREVWQEVQQVRWNRLGFTLTQSTLLFT